MSYSVEFACSVLLILLSSVLAALGLVVLLVTVLERTGAL